MKSIIVIFVTLLSVLFLAPASYAEDLDDRGVHVVGDSITYRAHRGWTRPADWTVDAFPGRRVTALGERYIYPTDDYWPAVRHIFTVQPREYNISTAVLALGTNGASTDMTVYEAAQLYAKGVRVIRDRPIWHAAPKRIVLVTPWKSPDITEGAINPRTGNPYPAYTWHEKGEVYRQAIWHVANNSSYVCVMDWASFIENRPELLNDGIHPNEDGLKYWRSMLIRTINNCGA